MLAKNAERNCYFCQNERNGSSVRMLAECPGGQSIRKRESPKRYITMSARFAGKPSQRTAIRIGFTVHVSVRQ